MKHREFVQNSKDIAPWRKGLYYAGLALMVIGLVAFLSVFVNGFISFSRPFGAFDESLGFMVWGLVGFILMLIGSVMRGVGARGLAGSGIVLDPQQAREDLHPYTDALGGMARDAVEGFRASGNEETAQLVKVRCPNCKALNHESAKFCDQCGQKLQ